MSYWDERLNVSILLGKTLVKIEKSDREIIFTDKDNNKYKMYHEQDCCEDVRIEDIIGDLDDLLFAPLLMAEEVKSHENPLDYIVSEYGQDSFTWTFYKFATIKGYVTIRWYGESNGYYSESVDFIKLEDN